MGARATLRVEQGEQTLVAGFAQSCFGLLRDATAVMEHLHTRLSRFGLTIRDMRPEVGDGSVGDAHLQCSLPAVGAAAQVHVDRARIHCAYVPSIHRETTAGIAAVAESAAEGAAYLRAIHPDGMPGIATEVLQALREALPSLSFKYFEWSVRIHGTIRPISVRDFVTRFVKETPDLGPASGAGVAFYFGAREEALWSSLNVEDSALVRDGLFIGSRIMWDGD